MFVLFYTILYCTELLWLHVCRRLLLLIVRGLLLLIVRGLLLLIVRGLLLLIVRGLGLVGDLDVMSFVSPHIFLDYSV